MLKTKYSLLICAMLGLSFTATNAMQVIDENALWSSHSYEQERPAPEAVQSELIPEIIHNPQPQIPSTKDFYITASILNLGLGTPIIHYRFGDSKIYFTRVFRQTDPENYGFKILSAALNDDKLSYYIEVTTGTKTLATYGTSGNPVVVQIISPQPFNKYLIMTVGLIAAFLGGRFVMAKVKAQKALALAQAQAAPVKKSQFGSTLAKLSKVR